MDESTAKKNLLNRALIIAIIVIIFFESWITFRRAYFLYAEGNQIGAESELMHVIFRYIGAIIGSGIFMGITYLIGKTTKYVTEKDVTKNDQVERIDERAPANHGKSTQPVATKVSRPLCSAFFGVMAAFIFSHLDSTSITPPLPFETSNSISTETQPGGAPVPPLGSDATAEAMLNDFASKSPVYRVLIDEDEDYRKHALALFKSTVNPNASTEEINQKNVEFKSKLIDFSIYITNKYIPYADDDAIIANMMATGKLADYFEQNVPDGCKGLISGDFTHFSKVPPDLMTSMRSASNSMLISGFRNFKAGKEKRTSFTEAEFVSFLARKSKSNPNFKKNEFLKLYEPLNKTSAQDICQGILSWSIVAPGETPQTLAKFYRAVLVGI
jgi:hypothetical protein